MEQWVKDKLEEIYDDKGCLDTLESDLKTRSNYGFLNEILSYEGIIGYTRWILDLIEGIYGITLEG